MKHFTTVNVYLFVYHCPSMFTSFVSFSHQCCVNVSVINCTARAYLINVQNYVNP